MIEQGRGRSWAAPLPASPTEVPSFRSSGAPKSVSRCPFGCLIAAAVLAVTLTAAASGSAFAAQCTAPLTAYSSGSAGSSSFPNDPLFPSQWGLEQTRVPGAWSHGAFGEGATVAIVDTGVDLSHPEFAGRLLPGLDTTPPSRQGCEGPQDRAGHGTAVAGIIGAGADNGIGVAGVAPLARLIPVRVYDPQDGAWDDIYAGVEWAIRSEADVINLSIQSYPGSGEVRQRERFEQLAAEAWQRGKLIVASAGNFSTPLCAYPGAARNVVCVAATRRDELPSTESNLPNDVDGNALGVRAPGGTFTCGRGSAATAIWTTYPPQHDYTDCGNPGYSIASATSAAAPFVTGVAALLVGRGLSNAQIVRCLRETSRNPVDGARGRLDPVYGYGIVDAEEALEKCAPDPVVQPSPLASDQRQPNHSHAANTTAASPPASSPSRPGPSPPNGVTARSGRARIQGRMLQLRGRTALIRVKCVSSVPCTLRLALELPQGRRIVDPARVWLQPGAVKRVSFVLSSAARRRLLALRRVRISASTEARQRTRLGVVRVRTGAR